MRLVNLVASTLPFITRARVPLTPSRAMAASSAAAHPPNISVYEGEPKVFPLISEAEPAVVVAGFHSLAVTCSDRTASTVFYSKIGFVAMPEKTTDAITVLRNKGGMEIHLAVCDKGVDDNQNILMDYATNKYPGHTHASFVVPNVAAARTYLESQDIAISGDRTRAGKLYAVFARDPDRTTLEFERNHGEPEDVVVTAEMIGYPQCMDHVGIRVCDAEEGLKWYAEMLGFNLLVNKYDRNPDPLKNFPPWISRVPKPDPSVPNCDINLIINGNERPDHNILLQDGVVRPGILVLGLTVGDPLNGVADRLRARGVTVVREADLGASKWACLATKVLPSPGTDTLFLEDREGTLVRLWPRQ